MIYFISVPKKDGGETSVVLLSKVMVDGKPTYFDFRGMLGVKGVIEFMNQHGDRVYVDSTAEGSIPQLEGLPFINFNPNNPNIGGLLKCDVFYQFFGQLGDKPLDDITLNKLVTMANNPNMQATDLAEFKKASDDFRKYIAGEDKVKVQASETSFMNGQRTADVVREFNKKLGHQFEHINEAINKTHFMQDPDDTFFVKLPEYSLLNDESVSIDSLLPSIADICKPYPHPIYNTPEFERVLQVPLAQRRQILAGLKDDLGLTREELNDVPRIDLRLVKGLPSNNDVDIQENEMAFKNALTEYIKYDISQYFPGEDVEEKFANRMCSPRMLEFLQELVKRMGIMNWFHTNVFPKSLANLLSDDDEDDIDFDPDKGGDSSEIEGTESYFPSPTGKYFNGIPILNEFIDKAAEVDGLSAYVDAIIKLARWGENKPTVLKLGNHKEYLDLNSFYIRHTTGNLESMQSVKIDGYDLVLKGYIEFDDRYRDEDFKTKYGFEDSRISIPVGIIAEKKFSTGTSQTIFISFIDLVKKLKEDPSYKFVKGIDFDGQSFRVEPSDDMESISLRLAHEAVTRAEDKAYIYYESTTMRNMTLEYNCKGLSVLGILSEYLHNVTDLARKQELLAFKNKQDLIEKMKEQPLPPDVYVKTGLAGLLVPVVLEACKCFDDIAPLAGSSSFIPNALSCYDVAMGKLEFKSEDQLWSKETQAKGTLDETANALARMQAFVPNESKAKEAPAEVKPVVEDQIQLEENMISTDSAIMPITADHKMLSIMDGDDIIGCAAITELNGKKIYILGGKDEVRPGLARSKNSITSMLSLVFDALLGYTTGDMSTVQARFHSIDTIRYYRKYMIDKNAREKEASK